jgi:hypothetical protein
MISTTRAGTRATPKTKHRYYNLTPNNLKPLERLMLASIAGASIFVLSNTVITLGTIVWGLYGS